MSLTPESFEALLAWLDPDRESAGRKYEIIRAGLVRIFMSRGLTDEENLADETINRVAAKMSEIQSDYVGLPVAYFRGVARNVLREAWRRKEVATDVFPERRVRLEESSDEYECLLKCLKVLPQRTRELILDYHAYEGADKIANHRSMANELRISESTLRVKAYRARLGLERCVLECVEKLRGKRITPTDSLYERVRATKPETQER